MTIDELARWPLGRLRLRETARTPRETNNQLHRRRRRIANSDFKVMERNQRRRRRKTTTRRRSAVFLLFCTICICINACDAVKIKKGNFCTFFVVFP